MADGAAPGPPRLRHQEAPAAVSYTHLEISRPKAAGRSKAMEKRNTEKIKRIALKLFEQLKGECVTYEEGRCIINALHARLERAADDMVIK